MKPSHFVKGVDYSNKNINEILKKIMYVIWNMLHLNMQKNRGVTELVFELLRLKSAIFGFLVALIIGLL